MSYKEEFMQRAVALSQTAYTSGKGLPIGCVIVKNGVIIGEGHNEIFLRNNPTAHGEMVAIEDACRKTGDLVLSGCDLYTSLEPCPMCLGAIYWSQIRAVYYANSHEDATEVGFDDAFIFEELAKPHAQKRIPHEHVHSTQAKNILKEWLAQQIPPRQA